MDVLFSFSKEKVTETVEEMSKLMNCDYKTAYEKYTHELIKQSVSWEDIEPLLLQQDERRIESGTGYCFEKDVKSILSKIDDIKRDVSELKTEYKSGIVYPNCRSVENKIFDTRENKAGFRIRRRECEKCGARWTTIEVITHFRIS